MPEATAAFIGGTGLYEIDGLEQAREVRVDTPYGDPSDVIVIGRLAGKAVAFLPRHGRGHVHLPTKLPSRANIYALKTLGVERIVSVNAVGALGDGIEPRDAVVPDQLIDRTRGRPSTFFDPGPVGHIGFADPFCVELSSLIAEAAEPHFRLHRTGTMVVIEGPAFSTRAESRMYRSWGGTIIGMTALPEAKLAREMEMCYASLSLVTDRDSWDASEAVSVEVVTANLHSNAAAARRTIAGLAQGLPAGRECGCGSAMANAIITNPDLFSQHDRARLAPVIGKYF